MLACRDRRKKEKVQAARAKQQAEEAKAAEEAAAKAAADAVAAEEAAGAKKQREREKKAQQQQRKRIRAACACLGVALLPAQLTCCVAELLDPCTCCRTLQRVAFTLSAVIAALPHGCYFVPAHMMHGLADAGVTRRA